MIIDAKLHSARKQATGKSRFTGEKIECICRKETTWCANNLLFFKNLLLSCNKKREYKHLARILWTVAQSHGSHDFLFMYILFLPIWRKHYCVIDGNLLSVKEALFKMFWFYDIYFPVSCAIKIIESHKKKISKKLHTYASLMILWCVFDFTHQVRKV